MSKKYYNEYGERIYKSKRHDQCVRFICVDNKNIKTQQEVKMVQQCIEKIPLKKLDSTTTEMLISNYGLPAHFFNFYLDYLETGLASTLQNIDTI